MREKYTQQDVQWLVEAAEDVVRSNIVWYSDRPDKHIALNDSLKPFRPDPDEQIILNMSAAYAKAVGLADIDFVNPGMKAVLAMLREKGLYAPTTETQEGTGTTAGQ